MYWLQWSHKTDVSTKCNLMTDFWRWCVSTCSFTYAFVNSHHYNYKYDSCRFFQRIYNSCGVFQTINVRFCHFFVEHATVSLVGDGPTPLYCGWIISAHQWLGRGPWNCMDVLWRFSGPWRVQNFHVNNCFRLTRGAQDGTTSITLSNCACEFWHSMIGSGTTL